MSDLNTSPFPWKPDETLDRFVVGAEGRDVCLMMQTTTREALHANRALIMASGSLAVALQALGIHPFQMEDGTPAHGYCFCPQSRLDVPGDEHTGECRDARKALEAAGVPLVTVFEGEGDATQRAVTERDADTVARMSAP